MSDYLHGYTEQEQDRLLAQAAYWKDRLILRDLALPPEARALEIGCGVGAVLRILAERFPDARYAGVDLQPKQIERAKALMERMNAPKMDLQVGDLNRLPWLQGSFDLVYGIWIVEHLANPLAALKEARRVLKPDGTICLTETDYTSIVIWPESEAFAEFRAAFCRLFSAAGGNPYIGRRLGPLLAQAGYYKTRVEAWSYHYFRSLQHEDLRTFVEYVHAFLEPTLPRILALGYDEARMRQGLREFLATPNHAEGSATVTVYRATGKA